MPIPSNYPGTCKDCGSKYEKGDMIDMNGNESPNTKGEIKPHWCKDGKNCQGVQKFQNPDPNMVCVHNKDDPTTTELRKRYDAMSSTEIQKHDSANQIIDLYIDTREACEAIGITNPITIGMILNNRVRDRN